MGAAAWWEPPVAAAVALGGIVGLATRDVIIRGAVGAAGYAVASRLTRSHPAPPDLHAPRH